jgi:hypothetical protein
MRPCSTTVHWDGNTDLTVSIATVPSIAAQTAVGFLLQPDQVRLVASSAEAREHTFGNLSSRGIEYLWIALDLGRRLGNPGR